MWKEFYYNHKSLKPRRRQLRNDATAEEKLLWEYLRKKQLGVKFVRQYSVAGFVLDFFAPEARLSIELDGVYHQEPGQQIYDNYRTRYLSSADIKELRFANSDVVNNIDKIIDEIKLFLPS